MQTPFDDNRLLLQTWLLNFQGAIVERGIKQPFLRVFFARTEQQM